MRRSNSMATLLLAVGAGWLAAQMWNKNAYGVRDRIEEGSKRLRSGAEPLISRGRDMMDDAWERGREVAEDAWQRGRRMAGRERGRPETYDPDYDTDYPGHGRGRDATEATRSSRYYR